MKKRLFIFLLISLVFCAVATAQYVRYAVLPESPRPGETMTIGVNTNEIEAQLFVNDNQVARARFFNVPAEGRNPAFRAAIITVPSTARSGRAVLKMINEWDAAYEIDIVIAPREFRSETLNLNPSLTTLVTATSPERTAQAQRLWGILSRTGSQIYHTGPFIVPTTGTRRTSQYGTRRVNVYSDGRRVTSIHAGVDFGIPTGTEVFACGRGRVQLSGFRELTGYSIVLEHAPGVYSIYYHLDSVIAEEGTIVDAGSVIGLSGSTGFSTGPHLHWEIRVSTENADPDFFVTRPLLDKNALIRRIFN